MTVSKLKCIQGSSVKKQLEHKYVRTYSTCTHEGGSNVTVVLTYVLQYVYPVPYKQWVLDYPSSANIRSIVSELCSTILLIALQYSIHLQLLHES